MSLLCAIEKRLMPAKRLAYALLILPIGKMQVPFRLVDISQGERRWISIAEIREGADKPVADVDGFGT
ncbi:hypothetical protein IFM46972_11380 [Aspergillus udagawae]|uniref:Uncharacterized protein n=1 Tax=Aspergillus udagawae TaxID=91492 RepID=A0A8E0QXU6_9EURO|nr:uncharacterized protein Aud_009527 [Aspergillus udagawae]GFF59429.1 hypothetical protein IFM46972_11380 [Aspergillus udagawae]GIC93048.1 hypothetical protein Aud_009527 [Aspergillus udagawae]